MEWISQSKYVAKRLDKEQSAAFGPVNRNFKRKLVRDF